VLGRPDLGPEADFFASGGHSLAAVELVCAVEPVLGLKPPQSLLLQAPNCRAFTQACARLGACDRRINRVCLQKGQGARPLYLLPPWNHPSTIFRALTHCEGGKSPVWCLEGHDADKPATTIEDIATLLRQALLAWHPDGDFTLAGFSMGGFVAWEIASQLAAAGQGNPQVLLLDCPRLYSARSEADRQWIARNTGTRGRLLNILRHSLVPGRLDRRALLRRAVVGKFDWWLRGRWRTRPVDPYEQEYLHNIRLSQVYPVRPYTGPVTLVRARHQSDWKNLFSWDLSWREHCRGPFDVVELDCTHLALLQPPHAAELSRVLQRHAGAGACAAGNG
jgi:thioesterase domain-containing protein